MEDVGYVIDKILRKTKFLTLLILQIRACEKQDTGKTWITLVLSLIGNHFPFTDEMVILIQINLFDVNLLKFP